MIPTDVVHVGKIDFWPTHVHVFGKNGLAWFTFSSKKRKSIKIRLILLSTLSYLLLTNILKCCHGFLICILVPIVTSEMCLCYFLFLLSFCLHHCTIIVLLPHFVHLFCISSWVLCLIIPFCVIELLWCLILHFVLLSLCIIRQSLYGFDPRLFFLVLWLWIFHV